MNALKLITKIIPFVAIIALNVFAQAGKFRLELLKPFAIIAGVVLLLNLIIALFLKVRDYFTFGLTGVVLTGIISIFIFPVLGQIYAENIIVGLYLGLFIVAVFPPLFKMEPFTFQFSKKNYPEAVTSGQQFLKINLIINYIWAGLFALGMVLTIVPYHSDTAINTIIATLVPIALQLAIGIPVTVKLPDYLMQKVDGEQLIFKSIKDLFSAMPFGLNKENAKGVNTIVQFFLTGEEPPTAYFTIKDQKCTFNEGKHQNPKTTIRCDSKLWLQISNNEVSGDKAFMNKEYEVEGDATIMLRFADLFAPPKREKKQKTVKPIESKFEYMTFVPNKIKDIVVFDGGPRTDKFSKTTFMVNHFIEGAKQAGANVEYIKLKDKKMNYCTGCYTCWTKTPGVCIFKDDMSELLEKYRDANLVVFSSPLYIFNVTGIMKVFMDRLLPLMKPYMLLDEQGYTMHPDRYPEKGEQGFVIFSAAGFPDVEHNFDGLKASYRMWDSHSENMHLMGEFFLTAAETIVQPVYTDRRNMIKDVCIKAGKQVVRQGKIDKDLMLAVQDTKVSKETFQMQADNFWKSLEGIKPYMSNIPKIEVSERN